jgi:hypothetical protein
MTISEQTETSPPPPPPAPERPPASVHTSYARVLRAVLLRELRQNWIVVALVFLAEFLFLALGEASGNGFMAYRYDPLNILLYGSLRFCVPASCIVGGLVIGLFQPLPDRNFDRWAFGIHRPVPRWLLFLGRAAAGFLLYALSVGLPLCLLLLYSTTSSGGHFFLWQYTLPYIADFFTGLVFYCAGLLVMDRRALICGSKVVPLVLAAMACTLSLLFPTFSAALLTSLICIVLFAVAALGSFVTHGYTLPARPAVRFANIVVLLLSSSMLVSLASAAVDSWFYGKRNEAMSSLPADSISEPPAITQKSRAVVADGSLATVISSIGNRGSNTNTGYFDSAGNQIDPKFPYGQILHYPNYTSSPQRGYRDLQYLAQDELSVPSRLPGTPEVRNHWIFDSTRNLFFVYRQPPVPYTFLGTFGATGFKPQSADATPFAPLLQDPALSLVTTEKAVLSLNKLAFSVFPIFAAPDGEIIRSYQSLRQDDGIDRTSCVVTDQGIYLLNNKDVPLRLALYRPFLNSHILKLYRIPSKGWWIVEYDSYNSNASQRSQHFEFYDDRGALLSTQEFPELRGDSAPIPLSPDARAIEESFATRTTLADALFQEPLFLRGSLWRIQTVVSWSSYPPSRFIRFASYFFPSRSPTLEFIAWAAVLGWAGGAWLLARFYRASSPLLWGLLGLLFGPALLLTFISTHTFPTRIKCPNCHVRRPIADPVCPNCKAPWPAPVQTGTEIFT